MPTSETLVADGVPLTVRPLQSDVEAAACATLMAASEPWVTLGRTYDRSLAVVRDPEAEVYVARVAAADLGGEAAPAVAGFLVLVMRGAFPGYVKSIAVQPAWRGRGLGTALLAFAERRVLRESPNVFLCVSSFNPRAKALYLRLGYHVVGELPDYLVRGHSEWLLRKSVAPLAEFTPAPGAPAPVAPAPVAGA